MKIVHVIPSYYPAVKYGGPIQSMRLLNETLVRKGIEVDVMTTKAGLLDRHDLSSDKWHELNGVRIKYFNYRGYEHYNFSLPLLRQLLSSAKSYDQITISSLWNFPTLAACISGLIYRIPYIIFTHGALCQEAIDRKSKFRKQLYLKLLANHYLKRAAGICFTTLHERDRSQASSSALGRSFIVPNGIDIKEYNMLPSAGSFFAQYPMLRGKRVILYLGRLDVIKGLDLLVDAFIRLAVEYKDIFLVLVGPDSEGLGARLRKDLAHSNSLDKVLFAGMLTGNHKLAAYIDAEIFVLPSYSENFGMAAVEAMACGTPVVISNKVGIYREVENKRAGVVVDTTSESVFRGIKHLLDNPELARELAANAQRMVRKHYDINKLADEMIKVYEEVQRTTL
jgi:glycosyltransferase involved in cell wall biosynthesis